MKFNFFTKREKEPSLRLRVAAGILRWYATLGLAGLAVSAFVLKFGPHGLDREAIHIEPDKAIAVVLQLLSFLLISRTLLRRERAGAVFAGTIFATGLSARLLGHAVPIEFIVGSGIGLVLVSTVWNELTPFEMTPDDIEDEFSAIEYAERPIGLPSPFSNGAAAQSHSHLDPELQQLQSGETLRDSASPRE